MHTVGHGTNNREPFRELGLFIKTENMKPRPDKKGLMKLFGKSVSSPVFKCSSKTIKRPKLGIPSLWNYNGAVTQWWTLKCVCHKTDLVLMSFNFRNQKHKNNCIIFSIIHEAVVKQTRLLYETFVDSASAKSSLCLAAPK